MLPLLILSVMTATAAPRASSQLRNDRGSFPAAHAFDGRLQTAWAEGADGYGEGSWLEVDLGRSTEIRSVSIWPGNLTKGTRTYREGSRPRLIQVMVDGQPAGSPFRVKDEMQRWDLELSTPVSGRRVRLVFEEVFEGFVYSDLFVAEVSINFPDTAGASRMGKWLEGTEAKRLMARHEAKVEEDYFAHKDAQFGDDAAFDRLCAAAADGAPGIANRARSLASDGYRVQAIPSSEKALQALRQLGDANAIPFLEMAAMRAHGRLQAIRQDEVERFYAYQDLVGGPSFNVAAWGQEGWERGALQNFGEPMDIEVDRYGSFYVSDIGNNRIQRFNERGAVDMVWGAGEPNITNAWFEKGRKYYVSGAEPGDDVFHFINPLDAEIIPNKDADAFAVLDSQGTLRVFDEDGRPQISWRVNASARPQPGLGGQGHLTWLPKREALLVVVQDEGILFNLEGEELGRFEIEDGIPNAVEIDKKGKRVLMSFYNEIVAYNPEDGFRYGTIVDGETLGRGFEGLAMTLDDEGRLWVLTDKGQLFKFKKPGKLEFTLKAFDRPISRPRIAVFDGILYATINNEIVQVDALQMKLEADEAAAAEAENE
ncbi:MAG: discoidin domain-containing protein [Myxococcota bacterium]